MHRETVQIAIIGGGPAGMLLALILEKAGIDCIVVEKRSRAHVLSRIRAGVLEPSTVKFLRDAGLSRGMDLNGRPRDGTRIAWQDRPDFLIDVKRWTGLDMMAYGQTRLTEDLYLAREATGTPYFDETSNLVIDGLQADRATVEFTCDGRRHSYLCDYVIGCDGSHGQTAGLIPSQLRRDYEQVYPFGWLGILAEVPPIDDFTYIRHEDGFALAAQRGPNLSRYYVQSPLDQGPEHWPDDRFWETFLRRAPEHIRTQVTTGPSIEKSLAPLRSKVTEPMRWGRLFLAGDAAHVVPPTGAKGLNMAIADVALLSEALTDHYATGGTDKLDSYSATALRRVWAVANLSWRLTTLLHTFPDETPFGGRIAQSDYDILLANEAVQRALAIEYAGLVYDHDE